MARKKLSEALKPTSTEIPGVAEAMEDGVGEPAPEGPTVEMTITGGQPEYFCEDYALRACRVCGTLTPGRMRVPVHLDVPKIAHLERYTEYALCPTEGCRWKTEAAIAEG